MLVLVASVLLSRDASGYEVSIYASTSVLVWLSLCVLYVSSLLLFFWELYSDEPGFDLRLPVVLLAIGYVILMFVPTFRGYFLYGNNSADLLAHLGFTQSIALTGHLGARDWYPILHILIRQLEFVGLNQSQISSVLSSSIYLLFSASIYLYTTRRFDRSVALTASLIAFVPFFSEYHRTVHPFMLSFFVLPLVFYCIERLDRKRYQLVVAPLLASLIFFHPITPGLLLIYIVIELVGGRTFTRFSSGTDGRHLPTFSVTLPAILVFLLSSYWYIGFSRINTSVVQLVSFYVTGSQSSLLSSQATKATTSNLTPIQLGYRFVELYGPTVLICSLGGLSVLLFVVFWRRQMRWTDGVLSVQYLVGVLVTLVFLIGYFIAFAPVRVSRYAVLFSLLLVATVVARGLRDRDWDHTRVGVVFVVLLVLIAPVGLFTAYNPNNHLTASEYHGSTWALDSVPEGQSVSSFGITYKFVISVEGDEVDRGTRYLFQNPLPDYLGYNTSSPIRQSLPDDVGYLVTREHDTAQHRAYFENQYANELKYTEAHLDRLHRDVTANKVYSNDGYALWRVV